MSVTPEIGHPAPVSDACDHQAILTAARSRRSALRSRATHDAYEDTHADELLARMLDESDDLVFAMPVIAAHLGDLDGSQGDAALRRAARLSGLAAGMFAAHHFSHWPSEWVPPPCPT